MKEISWFTPPIPQNQGYGIASVETINALERAGITVRWNNDEPRVHISFVQPEWYSGNDYQYKIGYTPWESTVIPEMWKFYMSNMQEMWTTSKFCKDIYEANGIDKVHVVPHGINPESFPIVDRTRTDKFIFFHMGAPTERKGATLVAKAFTEVFENIDDAYLLMKSTGVSDARWVNHGRWMGNINNHPRVQVIESDIDEYQIFELYQVAHCCVYPSYGEGFGFIPFQAMATGMPTIVTNKTGMADFADKAIPLDSEWGPGWGLHLGEWAIPDYDHLCHLMLDVYNNWEEYKKKAVQEARIIHATQTWDHIAQLIIELLGDKILERAQNFV